MSVIVEILDGRKAIFDYDHAKVNNNSFDQINFYKGIRSKKGGKSPMFNFAIWTTSK